MICTFRMTHYYLHMYLKVFGTSALKYMSLIQFNFFNTRTSMASVFKQDRNRTRIIK